MTQFRYFKFLFSMRPYRWEVILSALSAWRESRRALPF